MELKTEDQLVPVQQSAPELVKKPRGRPRKVTKLVCTNTVFKFVYEKKT